MGHPVPPGGVGPDLRKTVRLRQRLRLRLKGATRAVAASSSPLGVHHYSISPDGDVLASRETRREEAIRSQRGARCVSTPIIIHNSVSPDGFQAYASINHRRVEPVCT